MSTPSIRTPEEIEDLKRQWQADPIWNIENTEGFEAHVLELTTYRIQCEAEWRQDFNNRLQFKSIEMGINGNLTLARYIERLERRIDELEQEIDKLKNQ